MVNVVCKNCGIEFNKFQAELNKTNSANHFCNRKCFDNFRGVEEKKPFECTHCKNVFYKTNPQMNPTKNPFCSRECYSFWRSENLRAENNYNPLSKTGLYKYCPECGVKFRIPRYREERVKINFCSRECKNKFMVGENAAYYRNGVTSIANKIRGLFKYSEWREQILQRDNFVCQECDMATNLDIHHINELSNIIKENNITTIQEGNICEELWDINNGITLCIHCHADKHPDIRNLILKRL